MISPSLGEIMGTPGRNVDNFITNRFYFHCELFSVEEIGPKMLLVWSTVPSIHRWLFSVIPADEEDRMETVINGIGFFAIGLLPGIMVFFSGAPFSRLHRPGVWINAPQIITAGIVMARLVPTPA